MRTLKVNHCLVTSGDAGQRLDVFLAAQFPELTRSRIQKLITEKMVTVNDHHPARSSYKVLAGDRVVISIPPQPETRIEAENIELKVCYQDADVVVIDKPRGMVVHPAQGNWSGTLVNALLFHYPDLSRINGAARPGIVHRLDKDTAGLLVVARNDKAHVELARQFKEREVTRCYLALVHGQPKHDRGKIDAPVGRHPVDRRKMSIAGHNAKKAITHYYVLQRRGNYSLVNLRLVSGRTHQIRVHMAYINHPVVGDTLYGPSQPHLGLDGQFLYAYRLGFAHPSTGRYLECNAVLPAFLGNVLEKNDFTIPDVRTLNL